MAREFVSVKAHSAFYVGTCGDECTNDCDTLYWLCTTTLAQTAPQCCDKSKDVAEYLICLRRLLLREDGR